MIIDVNGAKNDISAVKQVERGINMKLLIFPIIVATVLVIVAIKS